MKIIVIGSGFGGLAADCALQAQGPSLPSLKNAQTRRARLLYTNRMGFNDGGPTIITVPG
jgi:phytoene desaturase